MPCNDDIINRSNSHCSGEDTPQKTLSSKIAFGNKVLETVIALGLELKSRSAHCTGFRAREVLHTYYQATSAPSRLRIFVLRSLQVPQ